MITGSPGFFEVLARPMILFLNSSGAYPELAA
jgi:hypothetical protein